VGKDKEMIKTLYIRNFTLIEELSMQLYPGFSVITGETGAGKSIILGAIGLLLGNRADSKTIKQGAERCTIEAHFDISRYDLRNFFDENDIDYDDEDCILRRELTATGKSRAFINDTPVPLTLMRELGEQLVDVHSQHQNLLLQKEDFQLGVLDIIADDHKQLIDYQVAYDSYRESLRRLEQMQAEIEQSRKNEDFVRFQYQELHAAALKSGEQEELEQQADMLNHAEEIKQAFFETDNLLSAENTGIVSQLKRAFSSIKSVEKVFPKTENMAERIDSAYIELKDVAAEISSLLESIDFDPAQLDAVNERLDNLYTLQKKYHVTTTEELIEKEKQLAEQLSHIENSDDELKELEEQTAACLKKAEQLAQQLTRMRKDAAKVVEKQMLERLVPLGIPYIRFGVNLTSKPLAADGADKVSFLFSANTSTPMQPVSQVASGGEIARVMLSLKAMISGAVKLPTIIFDEIDTGVSGKIAEKMALMMQEMGNKDRQVISITHLPQIAARGSHHYKVFKVETPQGTQTQMKQLEPDERIHEIAQMLSGESVTEAALQNSRELLGVKN
jgi:DNA repair protein RecN (Recombination protein N)